MMSFAWLHRILDLYGPSRRLRVVEDDALPSKMPWRDLVLTKDEGEAWSVGMRCPCRCGDTIELLLIPEANPRWDMKIDERRRPTLSPSVWRTKGCESHFWVRLGRIQWCE